MGGMNNIISEQKLAANRRNALKSTGPKTLRGKAVVSRNALKYGVLADAVVVRGHVVKESPQEYEELCRELHESLAPVGLLEEMLTGQIAAVAWRLRRVRKAEAGEIALSVDEGQKKRSEVRPALVFSEWDLTGDRLKAMEGSKVGNDLIIHWLEEVRQQVEEAGELSEESVKIPGLGSKNKLSKMLAELRLKVWPRREGASDEEYREEVVSGTLGGIDGMIEHYEGKREGCKQREQTEEEARQSAAVLPKEETLGKIMRYESALERQLFRAMNHLERLQERRRKNAEKEPLPEKHENAKRTQPEIANIA